MKLFVVKLACFEHERTCNCFGEMFISQFIIFSIPSQREAKGKFCVAYILNDIISKQSEVPGPLCCFLYTCHSF